MTRPAITWNVVGFSELDNLHLYEVLRLRTDVFVVEQRCPYPELDGLDRSAHHVVGRHADGTLIAYARILPPDVDGLPHIGRVVVHPHHRGQGLGRLAMRKCLEFLEDRWGSVASAISAQEHLRGFYESLGYRPVSEVYDWDGIPHIDMRLTAPA